MISRTRSVLNRLVFFSSRRIAPKNEARASACPGNNSFSFHSKVSFDVSQRSFTSSSQSFESNVLKDSSVSLKPFRIFSGIQPTGVIHLGNYLGALANWRNLQDAEVVKRQVSSEYASKSYLPLYCIVDLHALTIPSNSKELLNRTHSLAAALLASGIRPEDSSLFVQSHVSGHSELAWLISCITPVSKLFRMTQFKDKASKVSDNSMLNTVEDIPKTVGLGLLTYPVLMSADVLLYRATHIPVGDDQTQHLELARELARTFNHTFKTRILPEPMALYNKDALRIMNLTTGLAKMSKSDPSELSRITIDDSNELIKKKIGRAVTDSIGGVSYDPTTRPGVSNLVDIYTAIVNVQSKRSAMQRFMKDTVTTKRDLGVNDSFTFPLPVPVTPQQVAEQFADYKLSHFKSELTDLLISEIEPVRDETQRFLSDRDELNRFLKTGADRANEVAETTMQLVRNAVGIMPRL